MQRTLVKPRFFLNLSLLAVLLASCASAAVSTKSSPQSAVPPAVIAPSATPAAEVPVVESAPTDAAEPVPLPVATSRGPDLHATDPSTANLASGQLQFVEFFRFT